MHLLFLCTLVLCLVIYILQPTYNVVLLLQSFWLLYYWYDQVSDCSSLCK